MIIKLCDFAEPGFNDNNEFATQNQPLVAEVFLKVQLAVALSHSLV